jgi:hypothetical protein
MDAIENLFHWGRVIEAIFAGLQGSTFPLVKADEDVAAPDDSLVSELCRDLHTRHAGRDFDEGFGAWSGGDQQRASEHARYDHNCQEQKKKKASHQGENLFQLNDVRLIP